MNALLERPPAPAAPALPLTVRAGGPLQTLDRRPMAPFAAPVLDFLSALSHDLLASPDARRHPDIATFAFWCRRGHLQPMAEAWARGPARVGRGLVLHIAPGNVPVNFAFSLAFGMLAGNANIVRVAEVEHAQTTVLCAALQRRFADPRHAVVAARNRVVQYARDDTVTAALSAQAAARVLWGGDHTIAHLRSLPAPPRCVDVAFADRYSLAMLDARAVNEAGSQALADLVRGFFHDAYLQDQDACSSPQLVVWQGEPAACAQARQRFWPALDALLEREYALAPVHAVDKLVQLCRAAAALPQAQSSVRHGNRIHRVQLQSLPAGLEQHRGHAGFFFEVDTTGFEPLAGVVDARYQTLTTFGLDRQALARRVVELGLTGIDRIVPVGQALAIGLVWDGHDLVSTLSRIVEVP